MAQKGNFWALESLVMTAPSRQNEFSAWLDDCASPAADMRNGLRQKKPDLFVF